MMMSERCHRPPPRAAAANGLGPLTRQADTTIATRRAG
ncbi:hypothetical protein FRACA_1300018 [Frankia canadensis]|uniref:Uncharacterized protein n=1 Tax=Frankia canadensis TaxID=1836972 RepID=A0A2I2KKS6_9ACTN|nr:hypothetical protein FRACA_1300018 [Frankia canadensis]SOU53537.1 hypothetical protein FRACA_1300018 [Frankia canadensis]